MYTWAACMCVSINNALLIALTFCEIVCSVRFVFDGDDDDDVRKMMTKSSSLNFVNVHLLFFHFCFWLLL